MNISYKYRFFKKPDIDQVLEIYNFHIENSLSNFEEKPLSKDDFYQLSSKILDYNLPYIVCEDEEKIIGFTYLNRFRNKSGYKFSFENSIYLKNDHIGKGIGNKLLEFLIKEAKKNKKIKTIIAVIGSENSIPSIKIHKRNGFKLIGTLKKIGFKKNKWLNAIYMQKILNEKN